MLNVNLISLTVANIGVSLSFPFIIDACFNYGWRAGKIGKFKSRFVRFPVSFILNLYVSHIFCNIFVQDVLLLHQ